MKPPWTPGPWTWSGTAIMAAPGEYVLWPCNSLLEPESVAQAIGACGLSTEACADANVRLMTSAPEMAALLIELNAAYESDPAELKHKAHLIGRLLKRIGVE